MQKQDKDKEHSWLKPLLVAGGSLVFYMSVLPLIDSLSSWAQTKVTSKITKIQYMMAQDQQETEEIADRINGSMCTQAIGFEIPSTSFDESELDDIGRTRSKK